MSSLSSNALLLGLGLVLVLAVGSQLLAKLLRIPAIVVLLPVGFVAGILTKDVQPDDLLGPLYQPFVSVSVGVILFEAGLRLSFRDITPRVRPVVVRLVTIGALLTWLGVSGAVALFFSGLGSGVPFLIGAILVVSGPTVVLPLLAYIRPTPDVRAVLKWEGVLIDPLGALLAVAVFGAVRTGSWQPGAMLISLGVGALIGGIGAALLWLLLTRVQKLAPRQVVLVTLALAVAALVAADLIRDDAGFAATLLMGGFLANQRRIEVAPTIEFHETVVQLLIGALFVMIAASVSPADVESVLGSALALVAVMVFVIRPAAVALVSWRSELSSGERALVGWMDPRGIVAGATASAFGLQLASNHVAGADRVLPIVFVAIFGTVLIYGLTSPLVARRLGVAGSEGTLVLIVGGHEVARAVASALKRAGIGVRMWVGPAAHREAAQTEGLDARPGRMLVDSLSRETELEEITDAVLMSRSDDFNALAAAQLRGELGHGHVYRIAPGPDEPDLLPPATDTGILGPNELTYEELSRRLAQGARIVVIPGDGDGVAGGVPLFVVGAETVVALVEPDRLNAVPALESAK